MVAERAKRGAVIADACATEAAHDVDVEPIELSAGDLAGLELVEAWLTGVSARELVRIDVLARQFRYEGPALGKPQVLRRQPTAPMYFPPDERQQHHIAELLVDEGCGRCKETCSSEGVRDTLRHPIHAPVVPCVDKASSRGHQSPRLGVDH